MVTLRSVVGPFSPIPPPFPEAKLPEKVELTIITEVLWKAAPPPFAPEVLLEKVELLMLTVGTSTQKTPPPGFDAELPVT
jgi:hypothetical protein